MRPIYEPKGAAKEYGDYALNIYTGCPHRCPYCYVPGVLRKDREIFHSDVRPREHIVEEVAKQLQKEKITGRLIHLCFTCDPYPTGYDSSPTREIICLLKQYGNHVQILTKGDGSRDFDLLDSKDWYGVTMDGSESDEENHRRAVSLIQAKVSGANIWVSFEPVVNAEAVLNYIRYGAEAMDMIKIGKLNYHHSNTDWATFGREAEEICREKGINYYIKDSLRKEMEVIRGTSVEEDYV